MACILPEVFDEMDAALAKEGKDILDLADMTSQKRKEFFGKFLDQQHADFLNKEYERRMMGDYTRQRLINAIDKWSDEGLSSTRKKDLLTVVGENEDVFNPYNSDEFLAEVARTKLGFTIDAESSQKLYDAVQTVDARREALLSKMPDYETMDSDTWNTIIADESDPRRKLILDYGNAVVQYDLVYKSARLAADLKTAGKLEWANRILGQIKSIKATLDMSYPRQMIGLFMTNPKGTGKAFWKGVTTQWDFSKTAEGSGNTAMAIIYAMPNFMNGNMRIAGVDIGELEEAFPSTIINKGVEYTDKWLADHGLQLGKDGTLGYIDLTTRAEEGYKVALQMARANEFNRMYDLNQKLGGKFQDLLDQDIGGYINSASGRAEKILRLSGSETASKWLNVLMFAPKFFGSQIERVLNLRYAPLDIKTAVQTKSLTVRTPNQGRGRAAIGNVMMIGGLIALRYLMKALLEDKDPNDEDELLDMLNPIATIFGKVKIGDATFDVSFGTANNVRAVAQILAGKRKNIMGQTKSARPWDIIATVFEGKASPGFKLVWNAYRLSATELGLNKEAPKDFKGDEITWESLGRDLITPITVENVLEQYENGGNLYSIATGANIADFFGIGTSVFWPSEKDLAKDPAAFKAEKKMIRETGGNKINLSPSKQSKYFRNTTPAEAAQREAEFIQRLTPIYNQIMKDPNLTSEQKKSKLSKERARITKDMNKKYVK